MIRVLLLVVLAVLIGVAPAPSETVQGESRELGIRFVVLGGARWCHPEVTVRLTADSVSPFQPDGAEFLRMLGRIRAVVQSQCRTTEAILFDGDANGQRVFSAEMSRLTKWRQLIPFDQKTHRPVCSSQVAGPVCSADVDAYLTARKLMRGTAFADTELTNVLQSDTGDLTFQSKDVVGKLRVAPRRDFSSTYATPQQFAEAITASIGGECTTQGGNAGPVAGKTYSANLARSELTCRPKNAQAARTAVIVWAAHENFHIVSLWAEAPALMQPTNLADQLVAAIRRLSSSAKRAN